MVDSSFVIFVLLVIFLSPSTAKPGAKPLAKSDPGHLVHDFYKCTSPVYRLSPECQQPAPQFATGRIFSESEHFVEGGGGSQNPHQVAQINWPSYGSNTGEKKNERMVMVVEGEEESTTTRIHEAIEKSSTRRTHDDAQTTSSIVDAINYTTAAEEESITVELADVSQQDQVDEKNDNIEEENVGQLLMEIRNRTATAGIQEQESSVWPSASYETIVLMPSIQHLPLENQEVTLTPGQEIVASQVDTSNVGHLPLEINNGPKNYDMLEQSPDISHIQPGSHLEIVEEEMNLTGPLLEKDFEEEEESPSVYDPIILMLQRP